MIEARAVEPLLRAAKLPTKTGLERFEWPFTLPQILLPHLVIHSPLWKRKLEETLERLPCSFERPWRLVVYWDDVGIGSAVKADNKRNLAAIYASFLEFGTWLRDERSWMPLGVMRTTVHKKDVGTSALIKYLVRAIFRRGSSLSADGVDVGGTRIFARVHRILMDEGAGKDTFCAKGSSGLRPCWQCKNVVLNQEDNLADHDPSGYFVKLSCCTPDKFDPQTSSEYIASYDNLVSLKGSISNARWEKLQTASGITVDETSLMSDISAREIAPPSTYTRDPMHVFLSSGGICGVEIYALYTKAKTTMPDLWNEWLASLGNLRTGRGNKKPPTYLFSHARQLATLKNKHYVGDASECLMVMQFLRHWCEDILKPSGAAAAARESFQAMAALMDMYVKGKVYGASASLEAEWRCAWARALRKHTLAHGESLIKPKHHFAYHCASQPSLDGIWLDTYCLERTGGRRA